MTDQAPTPGFRRQQTDYTCGPCSLLMALDRADAPLTEELDIWRQANILHQGRGNAGTGPAGLARVARRQGWSASVWQRPPGPVMLASIRNPEHRAHSAALQNEDRRRAEEEGVSFHTHAMRGTDLRAALDKGSRALVLVSGGHVSHWIMVYAADDKGIYFRDPDPGPDTDMTKPMPWAEFEALRRYGRDRLQCVVLLERPPAPKPTEDKPAVSSNGPKRGR